MPLKTVYGRFSPPTSPPHPFPHRTKFFFAFVSWVRMWLVCSVAKVIQCTGPRIGKDSLDLGVLTFHHGSIQTWTTWKKADLQVHALEVPI